MVKRLLRYVKGTVDQGIVFPKTDGSRLRLTVFSDADMGQDINGNEAPLACSFFSGRPQSHGCR